MELLEKSIAIATEIHEGQYRRNGEPYINHPLRVMRLADIFGYSVLTQCVAVLHDAPEDAPDNPIGFTTEEVFEYLACEGYSDEVLIPLRCLTKDSSVIDTPKKYYNQYIKNTIAPNPRARAVKKFDLLDNLNFNNLLHPNSKERAKERLYLKSFVYLVRKYQALV